MFTRFKRSSKLLFLDPMDTQAKEYDKGQKLSIILSPSLYWVQKLSLPVKYVREVKKLLPSIFEEILPEGNYSYTAYKSGDIFYIFAYEDKKILKLLSDCGINMSDIQSIHFAQSEFIKLDAPVVINNKQTLYVKDDILLVAPTIWFDNLQDLDLGEITVSKHRVTLQQYGHIVKSSSLYKIAILLGALILIIFVENIMTSQKINQIDDAKDELFSKYKLQSTIFQNKSLLKKYNGIYMKQTRLRKNISYFLTMRLKQTQKVTLIDYKNSVLKVMISGVKKGSEQDILNTLNTKKVKFKHSFNDNSIIVKVKI